jgi:hypothetical protein
MRNNPYLTKSRILIHLSVISAEFQKFALELNDLNPDCQFSNRIREMKLFQIRNYVDRTINELRKIDIKELQNEY